MKSIKQTIQEKITDNHSNSLTLNEAISNNIESKGFLEKLKARLKKEFSHLGKETILTVLNIYYVIIDHKTPIKEKLAAISAFICFIAPDSEFGKVLPSEVPNDPSSLIEYTSDFLDRYITDDIENHSLLTYQEWFE